jgi:hypothetical protein
VAIPSSFEAFLAHPAPGLHFPAHPHSRTAEYVTPAPHDIRPPASAELLGRVEAEVTAPAVRRELLDFYGRWNGVGLLCLPDLLNDIPRAPALAILSVEESAELTEDLESAESSFMFEGLEEMYRPGSYRVVAAHGSEGTRLVLFTEGEYKGRPLAGKMFCVALDPVLGFTDVVAESFMGFLDAVARDPIAFLEHIGYCYTAVSRSGEYWGAEPDQYLPDVRGLPGIKARTETTRRDHR